MVLQVSAQAMQAFMQSIIMESFFAIGSHAAAHIRHISSHIMHILGDIIESRIMKSAHIWHI